MRAPGHPDDVPARRVRAERSLSDYAHNLDFGRTSPITLGTAVKLDDSQWQQAASQQFGRVLNISAMDFARQRATFKVETI
ncbi:hypothetical protein VTI74DRAFT_2517 [Chaetomium olivicolor]